MKMISLEKPPLNELVHFGVRGMKWGVRKGNEAAYRKKLSNIQSDKNMHKSDLKRFKYRSRSLGGRIADNAVKATGQMIVKDLLTGKFGHYQYMSKQEIVKRVTNIATKTAISMATRDALAKSASKNYQASGKKITGTRTHKITKEDTIESGIKLAMIVLPIAKKIGTIKIGKALRERQRGEAAFNNWGQNILSEKVNNVIWTDGNMAVIDKR